MKYTHESPDRSFNSTDNATSYLFNGCIFTLGRDGRSVINSLVLPPLPLLADNKEEREALAKQNANWFSKKKLEVKQSINEMINKVCLILEQYTNQPFIPNKGYYLDDPEPHEPVDNSPMSTEEYERLLLVHNL